MANVHENVGAEEFDQPVSVETFSRTESERRKSGAARKFSLFIKQLAAWGLVAGSILPGLESALQQRQSPPEDEKTERLDPEIANHEENLRYLRSIYGEESVARLAPGRNFYQSREYYATQPTRILRGRNEGVTGLADLEKDFGLTGPELEQVFIETYPKNMLDANVNTIVLDPGAPDPTDHPEKVRNLGPTVGKMVEEAYGSREYLFQERLSDAVQTHSHEIGHAISQTSNVDRSAQEKADLWRRVTARVLEGKNKYISSYVLDVAFQEDASLEEIVDEYFAEICAAYFQEPDNLEKNNPEDFVIVDSWIRAHDPLFDPAAAARRRQQIIIAKAR